MDISKIDEGYQITKINAGSVGHVELVTGMCENKPFKAIVKTQKKWERPGDPNSWRREYDLYVSDLEKIFTENFCWPKCYHAEINSDETKLWLEYIEGISGPDLTVEMCEKIAEGLGNFHRKLYEEKHTLTVENLCRPDAMKNFYHYNRSSHDLYNYIRQPDCKIPSHLCEMIISMDEKSDDIWAEIEKLPIVLRHGDFFPPNIFFTDGKITPIDWDSAGWSYLGEDLVGFITETNDIDHMVELYHKCVPAYLKGFSEGTTQIKNPYIYERIVMHMGYMLISKFTWKNTEKTPAEQEFDMVVLQKIYEMKGELNPS